MTPSSPPPWLMRSCKIWWAKRRSGRWRRARPVRDRLYPILMDVLCSVILASQISARGRRQGSDDAELGQDYRTFGIASNALILPFSS